LNAGTGDEIFLPVQHLAFSGIAATVVARDLTVYTQDDDFLAIPQVRIVRV